MVRSEFTIFIIGLTALTAGGCADGKTPTSPTPAMAVISPAAAGTTLDGGDVVSDPLGSRGRIKLEGFAAGVSGACPNLSFTINGQPVTTIVWTQFEDGFCSSIQNGTKVKVKGGRQPNGGLLAEEVDIDYSVPEVRLAGTVSGLSAGCPNLRFTLNGTPIATHPFTEFDDGFCGAVQNGTWVEVRGTIQQDGSLLARKLDIDYSTPEIKLVGPVAGLDAGCPNPTFTVNGTSVVTQPFTRYEDGFCGSLQNGTWVEVKGITQSDGRVWASKIDIGSSSFEIKIEGVAVGVGGGCPAITFGVNGMAVVTHAFTRFDNGFCDTVQHGTWVEVKGIRQPDGTLLANKIDIDAGALDVELRGAPSGFTGVCPDTRFSVGGMTVVTNGATRFKDGPCTFVPSAWRVDVDGLRQPDGSVLAYAVEIDY